MQRLLHHKNSYMHTTEQSLQRAASHTVRRKGAALLELLCGTPQPTQKMTQSQCDADANVSHIIIYIHDITHPELDSQSKKMQCQQPELSQHCTSERAEP
jgi:hypothetical protein